MLSPETDGAPVDVTRLDAVMIRERVDAARRRADAAGRRAAELAERRAELAAGAVPSVSSTAAARVGLKNAMRRAAVAGAAAAAAAAESARSRRVGSPTDAPADG